MVWKPSYGRICRLVTRKVIRCNTSFRMIYATWTLRVCCPLVPTSETCNRSIVLQLHFLELDQSGEYWAAFSYAPRKMEGKYGRLQPFLNASCLHGLFSRKDTHCHLCLVSDKSVTRLCKHSQFSREVIKLAGDPEWQKRGHRWEWLVTRGLHIFIVC